MTTTLSQQPWLPFCLYSVLHLSLPHCLSPFFISDTEAVAVVLKHTQLAADDLVNCLQPYPKIGGPLPHHYQLFAITFIIIA